MSESLFAKAVATFSSAKKRYWTPSTKSAVYAAQAGVTLGLAIGAAAVGQTWVSGSLAGAVVRASTKAYQSYKEGKKAAFEGAPVRGGSPLTGDDFWRDQGQQAAVGMTDDDLVAFHSGGSKALVYADDYSLIGVAGMSEAAGRGFDNVIAIGLKDGPSAAKAYMDGVRSNLESRNFRPSVSTPPRPAVGGVVGGGASGGVVRLRASLQNLVNDVSLPKATLENLAQAIADFRDRFEDAIGSSASASDVSEALGHAADAIEEAGSSLSAATTRATDYIEQLGE